MSEITRNLSYNDIKLLKKNTAGRTKRREEKEKQTQSQDRQIERRD